MGLKEYLENNPYGFKVDCVDLDIDHIRNIIIFFEKYNSLDKLNKEYLEYFNKRINDGK